MNKKTIVSGITATGNLTIGNYFGAIKSFLELQKSENLFIFVADLHAITIDINPDKLRENKKQIFSLLLASGIDPEKTTIFFQSDNSNHLKLNWITTCNSSIGELQRMTQFKDKSDNIKVMENGTINIPTGLFVYPTLMAADIILYNPDLVPVGIDQKQHLELCQKIVQKLNKKYNFSFKVPKPYFSKTGAKIMSLSNPSKKMSKSDPDLNASIYLLDKEEDVIKKISKAVTDNENKIYFSEDKKGISNLLNIYISTKGISQEEALEIFKDKDYGFFKKEVAKEVNKLLNSIQIKYEFFYNQIDKYAKQGALKAIEATNLVIDDIYKKIGFN
ncbi:MAG: tryptophan--tRNA ligase [Metamycoplasmataceae bacterium]